MGAACSCLLACGQFDAFWTQATANLSRAEVHLILLKHAIPQLHKTIQYQKLVNNISQFLYELRCCLFLEKQGILSQLQVWHPRKISSNLHCISMKDQHEDFTTRSNALQDVLVICFVEEACFANCAIALGNHVD